MLTRAWLNSPNSKKILLLIILPTLLSSCDFFSKKILAKPVVQVGTVELSAQQFSQSLAERLKPLDALSAKHPKNLTFFKEQIVNDFIVSTLVDLWLSEKKISVEQAELDAAIKTVVASYPSDFAFRESLSEADLCFPEWEKQIEVGVKKKRLLKELEKEANAITESELYAFYDSHRSQYEQRESVLLSHILVEDENQAEIVKKLLKQQKFSDVAKTYSAAYTAQSEDLYGSIEREFSLGLEKAFKLPVGAVFGPIKMSDGYHIFKINQKRPYKQKAFSEVRKEVENEVAALRETSKFTSWLDVQLKRYKIKKNLNMLDSIKVETQ
jgi:parvulin-like peptidyl-prolyl isomerase